MIWAVFVCLATMAAQAQTIEWQGGTADYTTAVDWVGGVVPVATNNADNSNGTNNVVQINIGDPDWTVTDISAGGNAGSGGAIEQFGQNLNVNGWLHDGAGTNSFGVFTLNGGAINVPNGPIFLGEGPGSISALNVNGGTINHYNGGQVFYVAVGNWNGAGTRTGTVNQTSGTINDNNQVWVGQYGDGVNTGYGFYNLSGGTLNVTNYLAIGRSGGNGTFNMTGGTLNQGNNGNILVGTGYSTPTGGSSVGLFNQNGGTVTCLGQFLIPEESPATGTYNLSGTGTLTVNNWIAVGRSGGNGVLNMTGESITKTGDNTTHLDIGASATGVLNQTNGTVTSLVSDTYLGENGTGTWNLEGGSAYLGNLIMALNGAADGTLNLDGGLMQASEVISTSAGFSQLNFNGATLQANANNANFMSGISIAQVESGGAVVDSQGYNIGIAQTLQDAGGGLTKNGTGTLTLAGANNYSGPTLVNAGTLITGSGSSADNSVTVADNAGFGVLVQSANSQYSPSSLSLGTSAGGTLDFNLGSFGNPTVAPLNISGTFTANGTITVNVADGLVQLGQIPLVQFGTLAGSASFVLGSLPTGVAGNLVTNGNVIALNVTTVNLPYWDGLSGGTWDIGTTTNWYNFGTGLPTFYTDGSAVVFDDTATGTTTVNVTTTVNPKSVNINNTNLTYIFAGSGSINGSTGLTKTGTNVLTILNNNGYTGPTVINGGMLSVTNLANGGSPSPIGASPATPSNFVLNNATFQYTGAPVIANRGFVMTSNGVIDAEGSLTLGLGETTSGTFTKIGPGTLTYAGVGTNEISPANNGGTGAFQIQNGTVVLNGSAGAQTNYIVGQWFVGSSTNYAANLILTNTSLGSSDWFALGRGNGPSNFVSTASLYNSVLSANYGDTGTAGGGGGISLGYNNGLANSAFQVLSLYGASALNNYGGNFNLAESAGSRAVVTITNSSYIFSPGSRNYIGDAAGRAVLNLNSTAISTIATNGGQIFLGGTGGATDTGAGALNLTAGGIKFGNGTGVYMMLGDNGGTTNGTYGSFNMSGGTFTENSGDGIRVGYGGLGSFVQSGGTFLCGRYLSIGGNGSPAGVGVATFTGGTFGIFNTSYRILLPDAANCTGILNLGTEAGGTAAVTNLYNGSLIMENSAGGNGTLNLDNGILQLGGPIHRANTSGGSAVVNLDGGTLQAGLNNITLIDATPSSLNVFKGGLTVDTMANTTTISGSLATTTGNGIYPSGGILTVPNNGGTGYIGAPIVTVSGGSGTGATAIATASGGTVTNVVLTSPGQGYQAGDILTFTFTGGGYITPATAFAYALQAGDVAVNAGGGLTKIGSGALLLTGANTYTGATVVSAGALGGTGSLAGPVNVAAGATLTAGTPSAVGILTINNNLTLAAGSSTLLKITSSSNDELQGITNITYGGALVVTNINGSTLTPGSVFKLFNSSLAGTGNFSSVTILPTGTGTFNPANGELTIGSATPPAMSTPVISSGNLILTGTGGTAGAGYTLLSTTNLVAGPWVTNTTGTFQTGGTFTNAIPLSPSVPAEFFQVRTP